MAKRHIKKGDEVLVLTGTDRGQRGKVLEVEPGKSRVIVEGVNIVKRHTKPHPPDVPQGGIIEKAAPIHISNVMLINPEDNKPTRVHRKRVKFDDGNVRGVRTTKTGEQIK